MTRLLSTSALLTLVGWQQLAVAAPNPVVMVKCIRGGRTLVQSGFFLEGETGVVTALHGVLECDTLTILLEGAAQLDPPDVVLEKAAVAADAAVLSSDGLRKLNVGRLQAGVLPAGGGELRVEGYPLGLSRRLISKVALRNTPLVHLRDLLPGQTLTELKARGSPDVEGLVLSIEGHLTVGHSGAPLFAADGTVVGIANGGLERGATEITWAVPLPAKDKWQTRDAAEPLLHRLRLISRSTLFAEVQLAVEHEAVNCAGRTFVPVRIMGLGELVDAVDDPLTYQQILQVYGLHGIPAAFVVYRDRARFDTTFVVPERWAFAGDQRACRAIGPDSLSIKYMLDAVDDQQPLMSATQLSSAREMQDFCSRGYSIDPGLTNLKSRALVGRGLIHRRKTYLRIDRRCGPIQMPMIDPAGFEWAALPKPNLQASPYSIQCMPLCPQTEGFAMIPYPDAWNLNDPSSYISAWGFAGYVTSGSQMLTTEIQLEEPAFAAHLTTCVQSFSNSGPCKLLYERQRAWALGVVAAMASTLIVGP